DDGYTVRFGEALEEALEDSLELSRVTTRTPGALRLTIETNLHPLGTGDNPKAAYVVILGRSDGTPVGTIRGKCRGSEFTRCAKQVVAEAGQIFSGQQPPRSH